MQKKNKYISQKNDSKQLEIVRLNHRFMNQKQNKKNNK